MSYPAPASTVSIKQEPEDHMDTNQCVESSQVKRSSPASTVSIKLEPEYHLKQEPEDPTDSNQSVESSLQAKIRSPEPASTVCPERTAGRGKRPRRLPQHLQDFDLDQSVAFGLQVKRSSPVTHKTASMKEEAETHKTVWIKDGAEFEYEVEDDLDLVVTSDNEEHDDDDEQETAEEACLSVSTAQLPMKKPTFCDQCGKTFATPQSLSVHQRTHTGEKPYPCDQCGKRFSVKYYLTTHQRTHTGEKPYRCDQCGKRFSVKSYLTSHQQTHTGEKPTTRGIHQRIHTVEKPYQCDQCSKRYRRKAELKRHYEIHTGETNFHCKCGDKFRTRNLLKRHASFRCYDLPVGLLTDRLVNSVQQQYQNRNVHGSHGYKIHGNI